MYMYIYLRQFVHKNYSPLVVYRDISLLSGVKVAVVPSLRVVMVLRWREPKKQTYTFVHRHVQYM